MILSSFNEYQPLKSPIAILLLCALLTTATFAKAEDGGEGVDIDVTSYIHFEPAFVVNFGTSGRIKYLRTDVAIMVRGSEALMMATRHKPYIRHNLVELFSDQTSQTMNSSVGRERLRRQALENIRQLMKELEGVAYVEDVFFKTFVVQN